ncbi:Dicer-like protein 2 [Exophiala xenobiotica]|nr:Dicer-like protein 2 [Exophiala xenobiotica]KAK5431483.1 Dicer-like protein 2 [Exophiala xenobiotica]
MFRAGVRQAASYRQRSKRVVVTTPSNQAPISREALTDLRAKAKNLIIETDVLEEGIDVTACNLVVCFDVPSNLKPFLQRRGRARQEQSTFAILLNALPEEEEPEEDIELEMSVPSTGAKLSTDGAMGRLYHFCALLPPQPYVDLRRAFTVTQDLLTELFTATVTLPNCISASARQANGREARKTRNAALKDAAFQAYRALFEAGLLKDHLLPCTHEKAFAVDKVDDLPAVVEVGGQFDPWSDLAEAWLSPDVHRTDIILKQDGMNGQGDLEFALITPSDTPPINPVKMYWDEYTTFTIMLGSPNKIALPGP